MNTISDCFISLAAPLLFSNVCYGATPGEAPVAVACNENEGGVLPETDTWVLSKADTQEDGNDHYKLLALSAWASAGNSTYCVRWELENQSSKNPPTTGVAPVLKNVAWSDVDLYMETLEPGGSDTRAVKWIKRDYSSTPIDQNTDVTGATDATFKLKAFLPRTAVSNIKPSDAHKVEQITLAEHRPGDKFGNIVTGYSEGNNSISINSAATFDGKAVVFRISVDTPRGVQFKFAKFPFALAMLKADSAKSFSSPAMEGPLEIPFTHETPIYSEQLENKAIYIVKQPLFVFNQSGFTCLLVSVYSPIQQSFAREDCK
jgi:hypothetical protein